MVRDRGLQRKIVTLTLSFLVILLLVVQQNHLFKDSLAERTFEIEIDVINTNGFHVPPHLNQEKFLKVTSDQTHKDYVKEILEIRNGKLRLDFFNHIKQNQSL